MNAPAFSFALPAMLTPGDVAPWVCAPTPSNPNYYFNTVAGRYVLLAFLPPLCEARDRAGAAFEAHARLFDDDKLTCFMVLRDRESFAQARNRPRGLRWFLDADGAISRLSGAVTPDGGEAPL